MSSKGQYVVVTTKHRGVFGGYLATRDGTECVLEQARVCVSWNVETKGFVGLAAKGPQPGCKISDAAPRMEILDITAILTCSAAAQEAWESGPWS